jgi:hypothetical protein
LRESLRSTTLSARLRSETRDISSRWNYTRRGLNTGKISRYHFINPKPHTYDYILGSSFLPKVVTDQQRRHMHVIRIPSLGRSVYAAPLASCDPLPVPVVFTELELLFPAANCHEGIAARPAGAPVLNGVPLRPCSDATDSVPAPLLTEAGLGVTPSPVELPLALLLGVVVGLEAAIPEVRPYDPDVEDPEGFNLCPINVFKLFSSVLSSFSLVSVISFCPSMALGIKSLSPRTSSPIRRDSSSLLRLADFNSLITVSTSVKATSNLSVRVFSDVFSSSVSFDSWSRRLKAFSNCSSIACLSCCNCGSVGGAIIG